MRVGARARYISKLAIYPKGIRRCQQREPNRHLTTYEYRDSIYGRASERVPLLTRGGYRERDGRPIPSPPPPSHSMHSRESIRQRTLRRLRLE